MHIDSEFRVHIDPTEMNGLETTSYVMVDKLTTIRKTALGEYIGHIDDVSIVEIEKKLKRFIGLD